MNGGKDGGDASETFSVTDDGTGGKRKIMLLVAVSAGLAVLLLAAVAVVLFLFFRGGAERGDAPVKTASTSSAAVSSTTEEVVRNGNAADSSSSVSTGSTEKQAVENTAEREPRNPASASTPAATSTENQGGGEGAPADELSMAFAKYADNLDLTKRTAQETKEFWSKSVGSEHTWKGKVAYVKTGLWKAEVRMACPGRMLYKGFNVILVTSDKAAASKLRIGQEVAFKGVVYSYKHKWSGLVIVYMKNVKFLGLDGEDVE
jgi:flagellar basal body-associated protein FliL